MNDNVDAAVLGAGSWGTALAKLLADNGHHVRLWARRPEQAEAIDRARENPDYLPGFALPENLRTTSDLIEAIDGVKLVLSVVPTHGLRAVLETAAPLLTEDAPILSCTKGIEQGTLMRVSQIFEEHLPESQQRMLTYLAGPSFAREVAARMPTAVTVAGHDEDVAHRVQHYLRNDTFRVYTTDDVVGAELGGALKNVIAIAAGIGDGLGFGHNSRAAIITRGLAEISRLAVAMGGRDETLAGLGGLGDLVLTCTGRLSRNRHVGVELGRGRPLDAILAGMRMVAEGVRTTTAALALGGQYQVELPIAAQMAEVLAGRCTPSEAVGCLMLRPQRGEFDRRARPDSASGAA